jgi:hypothetical protein
MMLAGRGGLRPVIRNHERGRLWLACFPTIAESAVSNIL